MKIVAGVVCLLALAIVAIALRNWSLVVQPTPVDLFVTDVNLSLPLLILVGMALLAAYHLVTIGRIRIRTALESRDLHRELDRARRSAETAELSRIADLRAYLDREIPQIELKLDLALEHLGVQPPH